MYRGFQSQFGRIFKTRFGGQKTASNIFTQSTTTTTSSTHFSTSTRTTSVTTTTGRSATSNTNTNQSQTTGTTTRGSNTTTATSRQNTTTTTTTTTTGANSNKNQQKTTNQGDKTSNRSRFMAGEASRAAVAFVSRYSGLATAGTTAVNIWTTYSDPKDR